MTGALGIPNLYVFARFTYLNRDADYRASGGPLLSNTDGARLRDEDFRVGVGLSQSRDLMLTPYIGLGWHDWARTTLVRSAITRITHTPMCAAVSCYSIRPLLQAEHLSIRRRTRARFSRVAFAWRCHPNSISADPHRKT